MAGLIGYVAKLYVEISSTDQEVPHVGDVTITRKDSEPDTTSRDDGGFKTVGSGLKELAVSFALQKRKGNSVYNTFRDAWRNRTALVITACDGAIATAGTDKTKFTALITEFSEEQPLDGVIVHNVTLKPTWSDTDPAETTAS